MNALRKFFYIARNAAGAFAAIFATLFLMYIVFEVGMGKQFAFGDVSSLFLVSVMLAIFMTVFGLLERQRENNK